MTNEKFNKLLHMIHDGDNNALEPIYKEFYETMFITARCKMHNEFDAQDAASSAIMKIFEYAKKHDNIKIDNASAYMYLVVTNCVIDIFRKRHPEVSVDKFCDYDLHYATEDDVLGEINFENVMMHLPENDREIALRYYLYGYQVKQIAADLNVPVGTVKWKLSEIRKKCKRFLS